MNAFRFIITFFIIVICLQTAFFLTFPKSKPPPPRSDLIIVFPGDDNRISTGFRLAQDGFAPNFAISGVNLPKVTALAKNFGLQKNVHLHSGEKSRSTIEDAVALRQLVTQHQYKSVLLVTSTYHIPRAYLLSRLILIGTGVKLHYFGVQKNHFASGMTAAMIKCKIMNNEMVKMWGSGVELSWYLATGTLSRDIDFFEKISLFMRKNIFYCPNK